MIKTAICITGSFCTHKSVLGAIDALLAHGFELTPVFSFNVASLSTRFFKQTDFEREVLERCGKQPIATLEEAEPLGTTNAMDLLIVAPCTGNTLAKLANGITDTPVTLAVKAHLRNNRPVVLAISSNDALGVGAKNIGALMNMKNIYFVPFGQDSPLKKPKSLVADLSLLVPTCESALKGKQLQPLLV